MLLMRASTAAMESVNAAVIDAGHPDLRPVDGLVFVGVSAGGATATSIAEFLGITKQSASTIIDRLVEQGYLQRQPALEDARAKVLTLTERGAAVTRIADRASAAVWQDVVIRHGVKDAARLRAMLAELGTGFSLRPLW